MKDKKYSDKNVFVLRTVSFTDRENIFQSNIPVLPKWLFSVGATVLETPGLEGDYSRKPIAASRDQNAEIADWFENCKVHYFFYLSNIPILHLLKLLPAINALHFVKFNPKLTKTRLLE